MVYVISPFSKPKHIWYSVKIYYSAQHWFLVTVTHSKLTLQVVLALASAAAQAQVLLNGALPYPYAAAGVAAPAAVAAPVAAAPAHVAYAHNVPAAVSHSLGLPEAATYVAPPVRQVAEAPIVEQVVEPVEQWGYKVAY